GNRVRTLALLDNGSDSSLCSEALRRKLGVAGQKVRYTATTVNGNEDKVGFSFDVKVSGTQEMKELSLKVLTVESVPAGKDSIPIREELRSWDHLKDLPIDVDAGQDVQLLIGADTPEAFWVHEERRGQAKEPYGIRTSLGWCVMGPGNATKKKLISNRITVSVTNDQLMQQLQRTWELDNEGLEVSVEDRKARDILATTTTLLDTKHYELVLLWKYDSHPLPCNKPMAESRLASLKRKLDRDDDLKSKYVKTVETYISKGHAEPVVDQKGVEGNVWYLPHHPVTHPRKNKVRVVFDCAAKWRGVSLNDNLLKGSEVISNLVGVLLRFRQE
ncbi:uncharacterized protein LOC117120646, partial [Anneissia japonica]|uniref:uncharacterized protein LOC117120646 n=1 Tax=Anneissia japonica TaxID=1529436 RepID=UPI00142562DF